MKLPKSHIVKQPNLNQTKIKWEKKFVTESHTSHLPKNDFKLQIDAIDEVIELKLKHINLKQIN